MLRKFTLESLWRAQIYQRCLLVAKQKDVLRILPQMRYMQVVGRFVDLSSWYVAPRDVAAGFWVDSTYRDREHIINSK